MAWNRNGTYRPGQHSERNVSVTELSKMIGQTGSVELREGCTVDVRIADVKVSYGSVRCLIEPLAGSGGCWISDSTITLYPVIEQASLDELRARLIK